MGAAANISRERHYPALDGLRGMAALMIVWRHFLQLVPMHGRVLSSLSLLTGFTWVGVDLFFVLSGFLITGILADTKSNKHYFRSFYGRRILRIFPLYYGILVIVLLILPLAGVRTGIAPDSHIFYWTYTSNFYFAFAGWVSNYLSHLWTLAIEEQFYFVWPLVLYFATNLERLRIGLLWAFLSVTVLRLVLHLLGIDFIALYLSTETHCDALILGAYLALSVRSAGPSALRGLRPNKLAVGILLLLALIILNETGLFPRWEALPAVVFLRNMLTLPLWAILFAWLILAATLPSSGRLYRFFSHRAMRWFGKYSYGLYVLHVPLAYLILQRFDLSHLSQTNAVFAQAGLFFLFVGSCTTCAFLSWHLYEKHFLKLKRYFPRDEEMAPLSRLAV